MLPANERQQRSEQNWFLFCGFTGIVGMYVWTESIGAIFAFAGLAGLIGEGLLALNRRLDSLIANTNTQ